MVICMYISIFYKKLNIRWVLCKFYEPNVSKIINKILVKTQTTKVLSYGNLICNSKDDLNIIYTILMNESVQIIKQKELEYNKLPNLMLESIKQLNRPNDND